MGRSWDVMTGVVSVEIQIYKRGKHVFQDMFAFGLDEESSLCNDKSSWGVRWGFKALPATGVGVGVGRQERRRSLVR